MIEDILNGAHNSLEIVLGLRQPQEIPCKSNVRLVLTLVLQSFLVKPSQLLPLLPLLYPTAVPNASHMGMHPVPKAILKGFPSCTSQTHPKDLPKCFPYWYKTIPKPFRNQTISLSLPIRGKGRFPYSSQTVPISCYIGRCLGRVWERSFIIVLGVCHGICKQACKSRQFSCESWIGVCGQLAYGGLLVE